MYNHISGSKTADRKWINHEIVESWNKNKGVVVIFIHNIKNSRGEQSRKGANPLYYVTHGPTGNRLSSIAKSYDPPEGQARTYTNSSKIISRNGLKKL